MISNNKKQTPFFILGNPRSGTSLFRLMLNSNPKIIVPPESGFIQWWYVKYKNWSINNSCNISEIEKYVDDILNSKKIEDWHLNRELLIRTIFEYRPKNYGDLSSLIYLSYKSNIDFNIVKIGDKNNYYIHYLDTLEKIYPKTKYIHLIRDGRDVACSYIKMKSLKIDSIYKPNLNSNIKDIAFEWNENITKIDSFLQDKNHLKIRYEDLLESPKKTLQMVCGYIDVSYDKLMLDFYLPDINDEPISTREWKMKTLEPVDINNSNKYIKMLSKEDINIFNKINHKILSKYGYEL